MPRKRTGNDKLLQVQVSPEDFAALERLAQLGHTTISEVVRGWLRAMIAANGQPGRLRDVA